MSKLSFRARALDPTKPMPIYLAEELPDLPEYSAINRAVPQMPSGMEKEEESVSFFFAILLVNAIFSFFLCDRYGVVRCRRYGSAVWTENEVERPS